MPITGAKFGTSNGNLRVESAAPKKPSSPTRPELENPPSLIVSQEDSAATVSSGASISAYHSTLFRSFALTATTTYNFYTDGELITPTDDINDSIENLPRYVTLHWRTAPRVTATIGKKGIRTPDAVSTPSAAHIDVAIAAFSNGYISPGVVSALISDPVPVPTGPTSINEDAFLLATSAAGKSAANELGVASSEFVTQPLLSFQTATVVNFIDPSIAGAFNGTRLASATDNLHLTVVGSLAKIIGSLEVISEFNQDVAPHNPSPDFVAHQDSPAVTYIGYVIERYDMQHDGSMVLGRTITIQDSSVDEFIDKKVAYGGVYAYRIRSIVQWSHGSDVDFAGTSTIDRLSSFSSLISPPLASFYAGDWTDWARTSVIDTVPPEPPDEVTVRPVSWKGEIAVSWKIGNNPQMDLSGFKLVRATSTAGMISDWRELGSFVVRNGSYIDRDVIPYENGQRSYIYALYATSYHGVDSPLSDQIEAMLSPIGSREELSIVQAAVRGADRTVHASGKLLPGSTEVKANKSLTFYCRKTVSGHPLRDSTYLVEIRSLSTGERSLVTLDVDATDIGVADA